MKETIMNFWKVLTVVSALSCPAWALADSSDNTRWELVGILWEVELENIASVSAKEIINHPIVQELVEWWIIQIDEKWEWPTEKELKEFIFSWVPYEDFLSQIAIWLYYARLNQFVKTVKADFSIEKVVYYSYWTRKIVVQRFRSDIDIYHYWTQTECKKKLNEVIEEWKKDENLTEIDLRPEEKVEIHRIIDILREILNDRSKE